MRVPYSWLSEFVELKDIDPEDIVRQLSIKSVEASLSTFGCDVDGVVFGKVVQLQRLSKGLYCKVQVGEHTFVNVYTSDTSLEEGDGVLVALPNARVNGMCVDKRTIEGVVSEGMLLSTQELGLEPHSTGVLKIEDNLPLGANAYDLLGFGEPIIEVEITPNRGDLLSVRGLAREISAIFKLKRKDESLEEMQDFGEIDVQILDEDCHRYVGAIVEGVSVRESPIWIRKRLWQVGGKSINNVVDITNYILFRDGQPLHAFDLDKIKGGIRVRSAKEKESIRTLMGSDRELSPVNLVISDERGPIAIAGVIGGLDTSVDKDTKNILLESAYFNPYRIRRSSKALNISTDSSYRFERSVDIEGVKKYQLQAIKLILDVCGGDLKAIRDFYPRPYEPKKVFVSFEKLRKYSGEDIPLKEATEILEHLEIPYKEVEDGVYVEVPSHRSFDMSMDVDVVEEILRLRDYNELEEETLCIPARTSSFEDFREEVRNYLVSNGLAEVITFSFENEELYRLLSLEIPTLRLVNPLSEAHSLMRTSLIPSLLRTCIYNVNQGIRNIAIFEIGKVFHAEEEERLGILLMGYANLYPEEPFSPYHLLRYVQGVLKIMGKEFSSRADVPDFLHPYLAVSFDGGYMGRLHPRIEKELKLQKVFVAEMRLERRKEQKVYVPFSKYPPVVRDLSLIVDKNLSVDKLITHIQTLLHEVVESVKVFSVYTDVVRFGEGKKSISIRVVFRSKERNLSDGEANQLVDLILDSLEEKFGAKLR